MSEPATPVSPPDPGRALLLATRRVVLWSFALVLLIPLLTFLFEWTDNAFGLGYNRPITYGIKYGSYLLLSLPMLYLTLQSWKYATAAYRNKIPFRSQWFRWFVLAVATPALLVFAGFQLFFVSSINPSRILEEITLPASGSRILLVRHVERDFLHGPEIAIELRLHLRGTGDQKPFTDRDTIRLESFYLRETQPLKGQPAAKVVRRDGRLVYTADERWVGMLNYDRKTLRFLIDLKTGYKEPVKPWGVKKRTGQEKAFFQNLHPDCASRAITPPSEARQTLPAEWKVGEVHEGFTVTVPLGSSDAEISESSQDFKKLCQDLEIKTLPPEFEPPLKAGERWDTLPEEQKQRYRTAYTAKVEAWWKALPEEEKKALANRYATEITAELTERAENEVQAVAEALRQAIRKSPEE